MFKYLNCVMKDSEIAKFIDIVSPQDERRLDSVFGSQQISPHLVRILEVSSCLLKWKLDSCRGITDGLAETVRNHSRPSIDLLETSIHETT